MKASGFGLRASGTGFGPGWALAVAALVVAPAAPGAQAAFDVASIKESASLDAGCSLRFLPDGGVRARNIPARSLITIAYRLQPYQLVDAPGWAGETRYDIDAKPASAAPREQIHEMLQALLVERFRLAFHREPRRVDGFVLMRLRSDTLGPDLRRSDVDCERDFATTPRCHQGGITDDTMSATGAPMWSLLQLVISKVGAPVSDETGLDDTYDFRLRWSNDVAPSDDRVSIYGALQEQLGLKLERRRVTTDVLVVDRLERPTPN